MAINIVAISGNLGQDPELRQTRGGTSVLSFSVCVNESRYDKQKKEWTSIPNWVDVTFFGEAAPRYSERLKKGSHVSIQGRLKQDTWEDKNTGKNRSKLGVVAQRIDVMEPRDSQAPSPSYQPAPQPAPAPVQAPQPSPQPAQAPVYYPNAYQAPAPAPAPVQVPAPSPQPAQAQFPEMAPQPAAYVSPYDPDIPF